MLRQTVEIELDYMRAGLDEYRVGRNLPSITETNSGPDAIDARLAYLSIGEYGAPLFAPWALDSSYPTPYHPYVRLDGTIANGGTCPGAIERAIRMPSG